MENPIGVMVTVCKSTKSVIIFRTARTHPTRETAISMNRSEIVDLIAIRRMKLMGFYVCYAFSHASHGDTVNLIAVPQSSFHLPKSEVYPSWTALR